MIYRSHEHALVNVPDDVVAGDWAARCAAYCRRHGYHLGPVVLGTGPEQWQQIAALTIVRQEYEVVVVPSRSMLYPDRTPRIESLTMELPQPQAGTASTQRWQPQRVRRRFTR